MIKTGIASYGMSGKLFHAPFIANHPGFELTAIVERNRDESRRRYPESKLVRSFDELLADDSLQLIIVNTPSHTHYEYTKAALLAGKHVIVEKPFTVKLAEAIELDELAKSKGLELFVYQNRRYDGDFRAIKEVLESGKLGDIVEAEFRFDRFRIHYSGKPHKEGAMPGAGIVHDLGAHLGDQALQMFGMPDAVFADIRILRKEGVEANDYFEILLFYPDKRVRLKSTVMARESLYAFVVHGNNGSFLQERSDKQEEELLKETEPSLESWCPGPQKPDGILHYMENGQSVRNETTSKPGNYMGYFDDVYKALTQGAPNPVPASDAIKTMTIIEKAFESAAAGKIVRI
ncbi:MAG: Gfo/Idh/MocA family oxidoreductase [Chitinophagaceae bacterium]|nr:Gfo/Idh/MocA family oxidoreductase [Chitinophagaceae bacterium]